MNMQQTPSQLWGVNLAKLRTQRHWTQEDLAQKLGISALSVSRWERGESIPRPFYRELLVELFPEFQTMILDLSQVPQSTTVLDPAIPLPASFIGRDEEYYHLKEWMVKSKQPTGVIHGIPGAGKTTLASTLANDSDVRRHYSGGILWAGLGLYQNNVDQLERWAMLLLGDLPKQAWDLKELGKLLRQTIGMRPFLLIVDDIWKREDALAFKVGGPQCGYIYTTRSLEIAASLHSGSGTYVIQLESLNEEDSVALLSRIAPNVVEQYPQAIHDLVKLVGGLPLALTLIGNRLRVHAASGQPRRLQSAIEQLTVPEVRLQLTEARGPLERHPSLPEGAPLSLLSIIEASDQLLGPLARSALYALSILPAKPNSFSEEAALAVGSCSEKEIDQLNDAGLLESIGPQRYSLHPSIKDYAAHHLVEKESVVRRAITYFTALLQTGKKEELLRWEGNNIREVLRLSMKYQHLAQLGTELQQAASDEMSPC